MLILKSPFILNDYIKPACLPPKNFQIHNGIGVISGFGVTHRSKDLFQLSRRLRNAVTEIVDRKRCSSEIAMIDPKYSRDVVKMSHMICALGKKKASRVQRADSCHGDSGGPLVVKVNGRYTLVGIISWGIGPNQKLGSTTNTANGDCGGVGIYTKVSKYLNFINSVK